MGLKQAIPSFQVKRLNSPESLAEEFANRPGAALLAGARTPMQSALWILASAETLCGEDELNVIAVEADGEVAAIAPLVRRRSGPPVCELLGASMHGEPCDLVYRDERALDRLLQAIVEDRILIDFQRMPASSPTVAAVQRACRGAAVARIHHANNSPRIEFAEGETDPARTLSSSLRSDLRRAQRRAEALGTVTFDVYAPRSDEEFVGLYNQALKVEASGWKGAGGSALAVNEMQKAFFLRYGVLASGAGVLRLAFMRVNGAPAAMQYAVEWAGAFWLLKVGYDETFSKCSPGQLLLQHTLRYAAERGLRAYEFLGCEEPWTRRWTKSAEASVRIRIYPYKPFAVIALVRDLFASVGEKVSGRRARRPAPERVGSPPALGAKLSAKGEDYCR